MLKNRKIKRKAQSWRNGEIILQTEELGKGPKMMDYTNEPPLFFSVERQTELLYSHSILIFPPLPGLGQVESRSWELN